MLDSTSQLLSFSRLVADTAHVAHKLLAHEPVKIWICLVDVPVGL